MAQFYSSKPTRVLTKLSDGRIVECHTYLKAFGYYREWYEPAPTEWMYGWTESEQEIDQETIEIYPKDSEIIEILEDIDWEVQDGWEKDYEPDWDAIAKEQRHLAA